ncbi:PP2C family serine/threonine-protein phosphatase [Pectobacterium parmentieri]|uniref:Protein phosphatase 2C domain-containing protein n=1 Tax=Pectobacterium parmentieri TaxID=1905730 RepID=A0A8B3FBU5_PECPM|nr:PP2C family serine/threonine-protein phosphatase [Pectobacterium parmentieri]AOR57346.1 phosphatase 2C family protein [Pectobacterium parmentieri]AYH17673.1 protein phosphatase 2C domain-containing protein [Pectobacterium parmentieri]AYH37890.1 protein phosphatase 2C domain-containing protein [Pectobacterium parmentieri]AZS58118.1 protein phosphatase 2C domain-containing protein [Pectobacterium parmentieri]MBI0429069.1 protein phosphatase 2C domain-containing protein [Pectobacterium parment
MDIDVRLDLQIFALILQQAGKTLSEADVNTWGDDAELRELLDKLREQVMLKAEGIAPPLPIIESGDSTESSDTIESSCPTEHDDSTGNNDSQNGSGSVEATADAVVAPQDAVAALPDMIAASGQDDAIQPEIAAPETVAPLSVSGAEPVEQENAEKAQWEAMSFAELNAAQGRPATVNALKPGQVPTPSLSHKAPPAAVSLPQVKINIANARVGTPFNSPIEISLDNGMRPDVQEVVFSEAIGLHFDRETTALVGIPTLSGDWDIAVHWSCGTATVGVTKVLLIVNPDPRSLWKIIDPPADDRYFKTNMAQQAIRQPGVNIAAASRRGRSHEHVGTFRDDDYFIAHDNDSGWSVLLVADGAGSAKNSRQGSRLVTEVVGDYLARQLAGELASGLKRAIADWTPEDQREVGTFFVSQFHKAAQLAVHKIHGEALETNESIKSYSTTLLATVALRTDDGVFAASFWLGDGAIAAYGPTGKVRLLGMPDSGEYAGQTRFLDQDAVQDTQFSKRVIIGKWSEISHLILMTDGVSDPYFETDNGLQNAAKWDALIADIAPCLNDSEQAAERLTEWLNFFSPGNHDDRTIVVAW